jgi:hypothetical protein
MNKAPPIKGARVALLTDVEVVHLFIFLGCVEDIKLDDFALELYCSIVSRGYDPLSLTVLDVDNDIISAQIDQVNGSVILSIPTELRIGEEL